MELRPFASTKYVQSNHLCLPSLRALVNHENEHSGSDLVACWRFAHFCEMQAVQTASSFSEDAILFLGQGMADQMSSRVDCFNDVRKIKRRLL